MLSREKVRPWSMFAAPPPQRSSSALADALAVYSNALLTLLNVRTHIAGVWDNGESTEEGNINSIHLSQISDGGSLRPSTRGTNQVPQVHVLMERRIDSVILSLSAPLPCTHLAVSPAGR